MQARRVVKLTFGTTSAGSGYLLTDRHVLTARHVVDPAERGAQCSIAPLKAKALDGKAVWLSEQHDLAIIRATKSGWSRLPPAPASFGEMPEAPFPQAQARGFPDAAGGSDHPIAARVIRVFEPQPLLNVEVQGPPTLNPEWWAGFSGAVVFAGDRPVGVTRKVDLNFNGLLTATPIEALLEDESFMRFWRDEGLTIPRLVPVAAVGGTFVEDVLGEIVAHLFWMDRETPIGQILRHVRGLREDHPRAPQIIAVPGVDDDMHLFMMQQLTRHREMQQLVANAGRQEDVILQMPWPNQAAEIAPADEFRVILEWLHEKLDVALPAQGAPPDAGRLRQALNQATAPRAFWVHVRQAVALGGYGELLRNLLEFWAGLGSGAPALLFLCLAMDKPKPSRRKRSLLGVLAGGGAQTQAENLNDAIASFLQPAGPAVRESWVPVDDLGEVGQAHLDPWIRRLGEECRSLPPREFERLRARLNDRLEPPKRLRAVLSDINSIYGGA